MHLPTELPFVPHAKVMGEKALRLLNSPRGIVECATLNDSDPVKYQVAGSLKAHEVKFNRSGNWL